MAQTVKISAGFSDKTSQNFNSTQYSISLEMSCQINGTTVEIESASKRLFELCKKIVSAQKAGNASVDDLLQGQEPARLPAPAAEPPAPAAPSNGHQASDAQVRYILTLARKSGMRDLEIRALPNDRFNKPNFDTLTSHEASQLIDELNQRKAA